VSSGAAVLLALASSLCWGTADFFGGLQSRYTTALVVAVFSQIAGGLGLALVLLLLGAAPEQAALLWGIAGGIFSGTGLLLFYRGLSAGVMSIVAPIAACGTLIPVAVSIAAGDSPTPVALVGIAAALVGVVLVSRPSGGTSHPSGRPWFVLGLALGSALCFGFFYVCLHAGAVASGQSLWVVGGARVGSLATLLGIALVGRQPLRSPGPRIVPIAGVGVLDALANALFAIASLGANLGVVSVLGSLYPVATVVLARVVLAERLGRPQAAGVVLALAGVSMMSLG
jgi:drug/metabolite transporter (DMT)-like permease